MIRIRNCKNTGLYLKTQRPYRPLRFTFPAARTSGSDPITTMNVYTHLGLEDAAAEMTRMEEAESARREQQKISDGGESKEKLDRKMFRVV